MFLPKLVIMYLLGFLGVSLYATKLPERLMPGILIRILFSSFWDSYGFMGFAEIRLVDDREVTLKIRLGNLRGYIEARSGIRKATSKGD